MAKAAMAAKGIAARLGICQDRNSLHFITWPMLCHSASSLSDLQLYPGNLTIWTFPQTTVGSKEKYKPTPRMGSNKIKTAQRVKCERRTLEYLREANARRRSFPKHQGSLLKYKSKFRRALL